MADTSALDAAIIGVLLADTGSGSLMGLMPDGVFYDEAAPGSTRFVIVSQAEQHDVAMFNGRAFEEATYLVKAVALNSTGADMAAAEARIDALLDNATLTATGYNEIVVARDSRVRHTEVDEVDASIRWQHRGGLYRVVATPDN